MEKKLLLMKSLLQTCYFSLRLQKNMAIIVATFMLFAVNHFLFYSPHKILLDFGLNIFVMTIISLTTVVIIHQPALNNRNFWWASFGILLSSLNIFYHNDGWSIFIYFSSYILLVGHLHGKKLQNMLTGFIQWLVINICAPISLILYLSNLEYWDKNRWKSLNRLLVLLIIPVFLFTLFISIYSIASNSFNALLYPIISYFSTFHLDIKFEKIAFFIISAIMILPFMIPIHKKITIPSRLFKKTVQRKKSQLKNQVKQMGLNTELKTATITFVGLNILVFIFNVLDIFHVWISKTTRSVQELSIYVHEGTNMVIFSIVIGVGLILIFFRKNLNFHPKNSFLKKLTYVWLAQNGFLALSVIRRNTHYIAEYGLTEKRLGVIIFIILVAVGLYLCYEKVAAKKSFMWFFNKLSLSLFLITLSYSIINHERLIIYHAIHLQKQHVDLHYLNTLSTYNVDLLTKYKDKLEAKSAYEMQINEYKYPRNRTLNWREWNIIDFNSSRKKYQYLQIKLK